MVLQTPNVQDVLLCAGVYSLLVTGRDGTYRTCYCVQVCTLYWRESPDSLLLLSGELSVPQKERVSRTPVGLDQDTPPSLRLTAALWGTCLL